MGDKLKIAVVGGGKMGEAIIAGWIASEAEPAASIDAGSVVVVDPGPERRALLESRYGVECVESSGRLGQADLVVLAVKPQVMGDALAQVAANSALAAPGTLFVTIAAGVKAASVEQALGFEAAVVRVMPNMPLAIGAGASGVCAGARASARQVSLVRELFACLGVAVEVAEAQMDVVCALSGSGPAYVAALVESLRDAAAAQGLDASCAEQLALQTVLGTARYLAESGQSIAEVRESICSPGGTTLAALEAMHAAGFDKVFGAGIDAAVKRSKELSECC